MIDDAADDNFDLVITKEISRFARNTLDSIQYTRQLLSCGVGVFFQNDNINTFDEDSELRLSIMSSIAQDELRKLSSRVKFGHQQAIKNNVVLGNSRIFGYRKDSRRLVIDETVDERPCRVAGDIVAVVADLVVERVELLVAVGRNARVKRYAQRNVAEPRCAQLLPHGRSSTATLTRVFPA